MGLVFRHVLESDIEKIFEWRNHPQVRQNSLSQEEIRWAEHVNYWSRRLAQRENFSFIIAHGGSEVGLLRLDKKEGEYEISIIIAPEHQGKGLGTATIAKAKEICIQKGIGKLVARVKPSNIASQKIFKENGFAKKGEQYELVL